MPLVWRSRLARPVVALAVLAFACGGSSGGTASGGPGSDGGSGGDGGTNDPPVPNTFFVDAAKGKDTNDGRAASRAFATLSKAASVVQPGWTVNVASGTYTSDGTTDVLTITTSGTKDAWITFQAAPGAHPVVQLPRGPSAFNGIHVAGASYVIIDGFEVIGQNASITPQEASANDGSQAVLNENCIYIDGMGYSAFHPPVPHDVVIRNSTVHECSGAGIEVNVADAITILHNKSFDNGWYTVFGESGIGFYHLTDAPGATTDQNGYRNSIVGNVIYGNKNTMNWVAGTPPGIYDGNGIIIDDSKHTQKAGGIYDVQGVPYTGRTYIANNLVHDNGGRGIHVYSSQHVDVVNNTTWNNLLTSSPWLADGEIDGQSSDDVNLLNNVTVNRVGKSCNIADGNHYDYNLYDGKTETTGPHDISASAQLVNPGGGDFSPSASSPALRSGTDAHAPADDLFGNPRPKGAIDRGAIQVSK